MKRQHAARFYSNMLTRTLSLLLIALLGLALGLETARFVHAHAAGSAVVASTGGTSGISMVNIHRALLGFSLLATSSALLLSLRGRGRGGLGVGAWLSRQWLRFTTWLELTLDGLFDFDALNVGDGASALSASARGLRLMRLMKLYSHRFGQGASSAVRQEMDAIHRHPDGSLNWQASNSAILEYMERRLAEVPVGVLPQPGTKPQPPDDSLLPCRGCSWCGVDPGDLPDELRTECDGSGLYLPSNEAEGRRQLIQSNPTLRQTGGKQPDESYIIEVGPNATPGDVARRHPTVSAPALPLNAEPHEDVVKRLGSVCQSWPFGTHYGRVVE